MWRSIGRDPKSSPPGRESRARPQRASSGPSTAVEARIRRTRSVGATGSTVGGLVSRSVRGWRGWRSERTPTASSSSRMSSTSTIPGTFVSS